MSEQVKQLAQLAFNYMASDYENRIGDDWNIAATDQATIRTSHLEDALVLSHLAGEYAPAELAGWIEELKQPTRSEQIAAQKVKR